jgi:hypothetical protein
MILGAFRGATHLSAFPIKVREVIDNYDTEGSIQTFTIVTASGLRFTVHVDFTGQGPNG